MIAIIDYEAGNLTSVKRAVDHLGFESVVTRDPEVVKAAERIIFPGVGAAGASMESLKKFGLHRAVKEAFEAGKPVLGICIGCQVVLSRSMENDTPCLDLISGTVEAFPLNMHAGGDGEKLKVPHMGWNNVRVEKPHPVLEGILPEHQFYFVHSYYPNPEDDTHVLARSRYGQTFASVIAKDNLIATQFHLEKSGEPGLRILRNFCAWDGKTATAKSPETSEGPGFSKRVIVCLDVREGKCTKGIKFKGNVDIGDPVEMAKIYYDAGVDEIVFYDITASAEKRGIMLDVVDRVARTIFIPFSVGGGIRTVEDMRAVLLAGAEKISVNSAAVKNPEIISQGAKAFGSQCVVLGMDVLKVPATEKIPSGYEIVINGGRTPMGMDALAWAKRGEELGAGEICLNSIDADGTQAGYELTLTRLISENVGIPVIASGGGGSPQHMADVLKQGRADAALVASIVHYGTYSIPQIKEDLAASGVVVRSVIR